MSMRTWVMAAALMAGVACGDDTSDKDTEPTDSDALSDETSGDTDTEVDDCPALAVDPTSLTFSAGEPDNPVSESFTVTNDCAGSTQLEVTLALSDDDGVFSIEEDGLTLEPGASAEVTVGFQAADFASYTGSVLVVGEAGKATVSLVGTAGTDADGDGYAAEDSDCDDTDDTVNPGATEVYYDGIDQDCDEASDYDADLDGYDSDAYGGEDCDDTAGDISPDATESQDLLDEDCDGLTDEDFLSTEDVFITELMVNPVNGGEVAGEWLELYNASGTELELGGWTLSDEDVDWTIEGSLRIPADDFVVVGASSDTSVNGGVTVDAVWGGLELDDVSMNVTLVAGSLQIFHMEYTSSWDHVAGSSLSLDDTYIDATSAQDKTYWCDATSELSGGDYGTPGSLNDNCTSLDHDGDGYSEDDGDCDDSDDAVFPDADELWDGVDNDCDEVTDLDVSVDAQAAGTLLGDEWTDGDDDGDADLAEGNMLAVADVDDDGDDDLILGSRDMDCSSGKVWLLEADDYDTWADDSVDDSAHSALYGWSHRNYFGTVPPVMGDVTGDGVVDLVVAGDGEDRSGTSASSCGTFSLGPAQWVVFEGGSGVSGDLFFTDGDVACSDDCYWDIVELLTHIDMDGDGVAELIGGTSYDILYGYQVDSLSGDVSMDDASFVLEESEDFGEGLGQSLYGGDLDGDGYDDLFASADRDDESGTNAGAIYLVYGDTSLPASGTIEDAYTVKVLGDADDDQLGGEVRLGDVDGDGDPDLVIGAGNHGTVYLFSDTTSFSAGTLDAGDADLTITDTSYDELGTLLELADLDLDGQQDLLVGTRGNSPDPGALFLFYGADLTSSSHTTADAGMSLVNGERSFPTTLRLADVSGDGVEDVLVGDYFTPSDGGMLYLVETP